MRTGKDETLSPKYSHFERERRFLVNVAKCPDLVSLPFVLVEDRYIRGTRLRLRRMTDSATGEVAMKLTKKYETDDPLARPIVTAYLTNSEYEALAVLSADVLNKRRYRVETEGGAFSVDQFLDALDGLVLAEIECRSADELKSLSIPDWVAREVSHDIEYQGGQLARHNKL